LAWEPPGEVAPCDSPGACLLLSGPAEATELTWQAPDGGTLFWYDTLRAATAADFVTNLVCVESGDASGTEAVDEALPAPGELWSYLVHARNACGTGIAGRNSSGEAIEVGECPESP
jgi:hypothetical protein